MQRFVIPIIGVCLIVVLLIQLFIGENSLVHVYLLQKEIDILNESIKKKKIENDNLLRITDSLKNDNDMIETIARRDMDMVHKDEVLFIVKD